MFLSLIFLVGLISPPIQLKTQLKSKEIPPIHGSPQRIFSRQNSIEILFEAQGFHLGDPRGVEGDRDHGVPRVADA